MGYRINKCGIPFFFGFFTLWKTAETLYYQQVDGFEIDGNFDGNFGEISRKKLEKLIIFQ